MLGAITSTGSCLPDFAQSLAQSSPPVSPALLMGLCIMAGVATIFLLPGRREASIGRIAGVVLLATALVFVAMLVRWTGGMGQGGMGFYFWFFSAIALIGAMRVITHTKPVYSALYFVLTVFASAGLFVLLWAQFMAVALVLIYAGAILVTYVFVIMLAAEATSPGEKSGALAGAAEHDAVSREPLAACAVGFTLMGVLLFLIFDRYEASTMPVDAAHNPTFIETSTQALGSYLFQTQIVSLELAGLILTIAMVGAIMIARKRVIVTDESMVEVKPEMISTPATPVDDNPHSIPVEGTRNPRQKAYPEA